MRDHLQERLQKLSEESLIRRIRDRDNPQGRVIRISGREVLNFSSNDYLGLSSDPLIVRAAADALLEYGLGAGASRLLAGGTLLHHRLEKAIAGFKSTEDAIVFNTGYMTNTGVIPALAEAGYSIFSDALNHASIIDGCRLSKTHRTVYPHKDINTLEKLLKQSEPPYLIVTDTVFSMDGDIAPIPELYQLCQQYDAVLYLDDAHGTGVLGGGRGALGHYGLSPESFVIQMGTLSKALGSLGGFVAADTVVVEWLRQRARTFVFSTALPAVAIAAALKAIELIQTDSRAVQRLWHNRELLVRMLSSEGFCPGSSETPIIPIMMKDTESALKVSDFLLRKGIYAPAIRPPTVQQPRLRITVTASHREEDLHRLVEALVEARRCGMF